MLIDGQRRFVQVDFESEQELENVVIENAEYLFGPDSVYLGKLLIKTGDGAGTVPDGYAFDLASRRWYIVEAELSKHGVWTHIAPQVAKQLIAAQSPTSKQLLTDLVAQRVKEDDSLRERFEDQGVHAVDVRRFVADILDNPPIVGIPIDNVKGDLREWAATLKYSVKLWVLRKYVEFGNPKAIVYEIPEEFGPSQSETDECEERPEAAAYYDVAFSDLIDAGFLTVGQQLTMNYRPRNGTARSFNATVLANGDIDVMGKVFTSPSYAAVYAIQQAGSDRKTENGWKSWRTADGKLLRELREEFLRNPPNSVPGMEEKWAT